MRYPLDSDLSSGLRYPPFQEQLGPDKQVLLFSLMTPVSSRVTSLIFVVVVVVKKRKKKSHRAIRREMRFMQNMIQCLKVFVSW